MTDSKSDMERERLEALSTSAEYGAGINGFMVREFTRRALDFIPRTESRILELGPAEGISTAIICEAHTGAVEVVEGSKSLATLVQESHPHVLVHNSLFEEFSTNEKFDFILMGHVLEHVEKPVELLRRVSDWLNPNGVVVVGVPNANSLHRQLAVHMGILADVAELGETDFKVGHRRVYNPETLEEHVMQAGFRLTHSEGLWLKLFTNQQIASLAVPGIVEGCFKLGAQYPSIAAEILAVLEKASATEEPLMGLN